MERGVKSVFSKADRLALHIMSSSNVLSAFILAALFQVLSVMVTIKLVNNYKAKKEEEKLYKLIHQGLMHLNQIQYQYG